MLDPKLFLSQLSLSDSETDVYLAMVKGALAARDIVQVTGRSRPTVYYALTALEHRGLISKTGLEDDKRFRLEPLSRLSTIIDAKQAELDFVKKQSEEFVAQYQSKHNGDHKPQVAFYEGLDAVRNIIMETVYAKSRHIDSLVPTDNFFWQLGPEFVQRFVDTRRRRRITTRNLWGETVEPDILKKYYEKAEIRMLPGDTGKKFESTIFMYDQSVLYISSLSSGYALLVESKEHYALIQAMYDVMWGASQKLK